MKSMHLLLFSTSCAVVLKLEPSLTAGVVVVDQPDSPAAVRGDDTDAGPR